MTPWIIRASFVFIFPASLTVPLSTDAAVVSNCDEASLRAALDTGEFVTFGCDGTILLSNTIAISNPATIEADGHTVALSGGGRTRIFDVSSGASLSLTGLKLVNGFTEGASGQEGSGGAIRVNQGALYATDCQFMNNTAAGGNGVPNARGGRGRGGAIFVSQGELRLMNCSFHLNRVQGGRGGDTSNSFGPDVSGGEAGGAACATQDSNVSVIPSPCSQQENVDSSTPLNGARGRSVRPRQSGSG